MNRFIDEDKERKMNILFFCSVTQMVNQMNKGKLRHLLASGYFHRCFLCEKNETVNYDKTLRQ